MLTRASLIATKLARPQVSATSIRRTPVIERMQADPAGVILVSAPAGFGKTSLLAQWAAVTSDDVAWVTLDHRDRSRRRFWLYVIGAIETQRPEALESSADAVASSWIPHGEFEEILHADLSSLSSGLTVVLDDFHLAATSELEESVAAAVAVCPPGVRFVIATRHDPIMRVARWRADDSLLEVRASDLRLDADQVARLAARLEVDRGVIGTLVERTAGWPVAVRLALQQAERRSDPSSYLAGLNGTTRDIADYLRNELLDGLPTDHRQFLMSAAALSTLSGEVLDGLLDRSDSTIMLRDLERRGVLLTALDEASTMFSLHELESDFLRSELEHTYPGLRAELLVRAANWYRVRGQYEEAIVCALDAEDFDIAAELINGHWRDFTSAGRRVVIVDHLTRIPADVLENDVRLVITAAWMASLDGDWPAAETLLDRIDALDDGAPLPDGFPSASAAALLIVAIMNWRGFSDMERATRAADAAIPPTHVCRAYAEFALAMLALATDQLGRARIHLERTFEQAPDGLLKTVAAAHMAALSADTGRVAAGRRFIDLAMSDRFWKRQPDIAYGVMAAEAVVLLGEGEATEARAVLERARPLRRRNDLIDETTGELLAVRIDLALGDLDEARRHLDRAEGLIAAWDDPMPVFSSQISDLTAELERCESLSAPEGAVYVEPLTDAETRVLRLLVTTHLNQRQIGGDLHISFNTVKSHVRSIYRKLGVESRQDAIAVATVRHLV